MSLQLINLLAPELKPTRLWLGSKDLLLGCAGFAALLIIYSGFQALNLPGLKQIETEARAQLASMQQVNPGSNAQISAEVENLRAAYTRQQQVLVALEDTPRYDFSSYLRGLAEARVEGVWLEKIELVRTPADTRVGLTGRSLATPLVPELLDALLADGVFGDHRFTDLEIKKLDQQIEFSLLTRELGQS